MQQQVKAKEMQIKNKIKCFVTLKRWLSYKQGQYITPTKREYFYYIDHHGQLFLDDAKMKNFTSCFKDKEFLEFFFKRLKYNDSERYTKDFPYISPCGRERNYVRCDDLPIVFTQILEQDNTEKFSYCWGDHLLSVDFRPEAICMLPKTGRIYHPGLSHLGGVGLIRSGLAIELSKYFEYRPGSDETEAMPEYIQWKGTKYKLTNEVLPLLEKNSVK